MCWNTLRVGVRPITVKVIGIARIWNRDLLHTTPALCHRATIPNSVGSWMGTWSHDMESRPVTNLIKALRPATSPLVNSTWSGPYRLSGGTPMTPSDSAVTMCDYVLSGRSTLLHTPLHFLVCIIPDTRKYHTWSHSVSWLLYSWASRYQVLPDCSSRRS